MAESVTTMENAQLADHTAGQGALGAEETSAPDNALVFGGEKRNRLYITTTSSLYAVYVHATPADRPMASWEKGSQPDTR